MERPILFNAQMVKAILEGRKTQTRRVVKHELITEQAEFECGNRPHVTLSEPSLQYWVDNSCPYGQVGDHLWVRETFGTKIRNVGGTQHESFAYKADNPDEIAYSDCNGEAYPVKWKPSIHMPRHACRLVLEITNIRVERLNDISEADAVNEGLHKLPATGRYVINNGDQYFGGASGNPCDVFQWLWESINGHESWNQNPWVWVVEFKVIEGGAA